MANFRSYTKNHSNRWDRNKDNFETAFFAVFESSFLLPRNDKAHATMCDLVFRRPERQKTLSFSANCHSRLVARSRKPIKCMLKCQSVRKKQTVDPAASNSDTLIDSVVPVYLTELDYDEEWWQHTPLLQSTPTVNVSDLTPLTRSKFWVGIQWLDVQQQAAVNTVTTTSCLFA